MFRVAPCSTLYFYKGNVNTFALWQVIIKQTAKTEVGITQNYFVLSL
jgi:hypothetical protein